MTICEKGQSALYMWHTPPPDAVAPNLVISSGNPELENTNSMTSIEISPCMATQVEYGNSPQRSSLRMFLTPQKSFPLEEKEIDSSTIAWE